MDNPPANNIYQTDVAIVGGGVAGLWIAAVLGAQGYSVTLLERDGLGAGQTLASQGMIHGGIKYTLAGSLTGASEAIADMPQRWRDCLQGQASPDLREVSIASGDYYMFSDGSLTSRVTGFFGSRMVRGRVKPVAAGDRPPPFDHRDFSGELYRLQDLVIDTRSLLQVLSGARGLQCYQSEATLVNQEGDYLLQLDGGILLQAQKYVLAAGSGNQAFLDSPALRAATPLDGQLRSLHQVFVHGDKLPPLFAHAVSLGSGAKPRMTITTHYDADGKPVWYLGGDLAETGVSRDTASQISAAKKELAALIPWLDQHNLRFTTLRIDRAEPASQGLRPDSPFCEVIGDTLVCWPTKLTLAPALADLVSERLDATPEVGLPDLPLPAARLAANPWDNNGL